MALAELTAEGLHGELIHFFKKEFPNTGCSILDCGAGEGAWVARLTGEGYQNVKAIELNRASYHAKTPLYVMDLNTDFGDKVQERFDVITAIEVIEHLESPVHFLRQCSKLLRADGHVLITTPNAECAPGRLKFFLQGRLRHFDGSGDPTHVSPLFSNLLPKLAKRSGLEVALSQPLVRFWEEPRIAVKVMSHLLVLILPGCVYGECHLFLLRRPRGLAAFSLH